MKSAESAAESESVHESKTKSESAPPRKQEVARPAREPAKSNAESRPVSEERNISRRPRRVVANRYRTRPPCPRSAINEPAAVVIRRPSPRLAANPSPAPIRFINPAAIAVRSPIRALLRRPNAAHVRHFAPRSVGIEIFAAGVITIGVVPGISLQNHAVAIIVERVPIIFAGCRGNFELRIVRVALNGDQVAALHARASLRRGNLSFTIANRNFRLPAGIHVDAVRAVFANGMNCNVRRINLNVRFVALEHAEVSQAFAKLNLNLGTLERGDGGLRIIGKAEHAREDELDFRAGL